MKPLQTVHPLPAADPEVCHCGFRFTLANRLGRNSLTFVTIIVPFFAWLTSSVPARGSEPASSRTIFNCEFQRSQDRNVDRQPDGWKRLRDRLHPSFVEAEIVPKDPHSHDEAKAAEASLVKFYKAWQTGRWDPSYVAEVTPPFIASVMDRTLLDDCYQVTLNGGSFELISPRFELDPRYEYVLEGETACENLKNHVVTVDLRLYAADDSLIDSYSITPIRGTQHWNYRRSKTINLSDLGVVRGEVRLIAHSEDRLFGNGIAKFDNIRLRRLPTLTIHPSVPNFIAQPESKVEFACYGAGLTEDESEVELEVRDLEGNTLFVESKSLETEAAPAGRLVDSTHRGSPTGEPVRSYANFEVSFPTPGLYYVHARMGTSHRQILMAVARDEFVGGTPFGLSLPEVPNLDDVEAMIGRMKSCQVGWVKMPIWYDIDNHDTAEATVQFAKGLKTIGIRTVGRLDAPPASQREHFSDDTTGAQSIGYLEKTAIWEPLLDPVFARLNTLIDVIQLGADSDRGFMGSQNGLNVIDQVRGILQYYFPDPKMVVAWDWLEPLYEQVQTADARPLLHALHFQTDQQLTAKELSQYIGDTANARWDTWASINPLPVSQYSLHDRVVDLMQRMIAIRQTETRAAFVTSPFNSDAGLFDEDGMPTELLVPWIQVAKAIGSRSSIGSITLPGSSENVTFQGDDGDVMILWNSRSVTEQLFFGEKISGRDIWGRPVEIQEIPQPEGGVVQRVSVGKWPVILYGVDSNVIRWGKEFQLLTDQLASHISGSSELAVHILNTLPRRAQGTLSLRSPSLLRDGAAATSLDLDSNRSERRDLPISLRNDATAGVHQVDFMFRLRADKEYIFTVHRDIKLGHRDIEFRWVLTRKNENEVEVQVELTNNTSHALDFDCTLFPAGQSYKRIEIKNCAPGISNYTYQLPIPQTVSTDSAPIWIRCEQIRNPLVLNYMATLATPE